MDNNVPQSSVPKSVVVQPTTQWSTAKIATLAAVIVAAVVVVCAVAIALGVSLSNKTSNKSVSLLSTTVIAAAVVTTTATTTASTTTASTTTTTTTTTSVLTAPAPAGNFSILAPPSIDCTYNASGCGCAAIQPVFAAPRIFQGYAARANSWPWMAKLIMTVNGNQFGCGGFLITYRHVVTAGHCIVTNLTANGISVYAGIQNLTDENVVGQTGSVATISLHPDYDPETITNDIAILTLTSPFNETTTVGLCCVSYNTTVPVVGQRGVIAGWGYIIEGGPESDDLLQAVSLVQDPFSVCQLSSSATQFCVGFNGTDVCQGDSGGPFMIVINNAWDCAGIVSYGPSCHQNTVFTRVAAYQDFITNVTSS
jgi:V8-like Glu-specific endopeptidase